jgi:hypothetical protein
MIKPVCSANRLFYFSIMEENKTEIRSLRLSIREEIKKDLEKHKLQSKAAYGIQFLLMVGAACIPWLLGNPPSVNTAQSRYTERKIDAYLEVTRRLRDGRNPHGTDPNFDTLPVHANLMAFNTWWRNTDDYYQENQILFDDSSRSLYRDLNVLTLRQMDSLRIHPNADVRFKHGLKQPLVDRIEPLIAWFTVYLNKKYGTEDGIRASWLKNQ